MRWIWLKRASKYLCIESDQRGPLIYALNLTEKGLQIFMRRIWPKRASLIYMCWIWLKRAFKYWDLFGRGWNLVRVVEVISVPLYILGEGDYNYSGRLRLFGSDSNYFWRGSDVFENGWDFFEWSRFFRVIEIFREGLASWDYFRSVEFFRGVESFFMGIESFSGRGWDIFKVIKFIPGGKIEVFSEGIEIRSSRIKISSCRKCFLQGS